MEISSPTRNMEIRRDPSVVDHLPPLDIRKPASTDKPKIVQRGPRTTAAPFKEQKHFRNVSDSIGNNYSAGARDLTTSIIYNKFKQNSSFRYHESPALLRKIHDRNNTKQYQPPTNSKKRSLSGSPKRAFDTLHKATGFQSPADAIRGDRDRLLPSRIVSAAAATSGSEIRRKRMLDFILQKDTSQYATHGSVESQNFDFFSARGHRRSQSSKSYKKGENNTAKGYRMPHFDFEKKKKLRSRSNEGAERNNGFYVFSNESHSSMFSETTMKGSNSSENDHTMVQWDTSEKESQRLNSLQSEEFRKDPSSRMVYNVRTEMNAFGATQNQRSRFEINKNMYTDETKKNVNEDITNGKGDVDVRGHTNHHQPIEIISETSGLGTGSRESNSDSSSRGYIDSLESEDDEMTDSEEEEVRTHDEATLVALEVEFPPYTHSTRGLSRAATPEVESIPRFYSLMHTAIDRSMISNLPREWIDDAMKLLSSKLIKDKSNLIEDLIQEVDYLFVESLKKSVLDYILLDSKEQTRLGVCVPYKPSHSAGRWRYPWYESLNHARRAIKSSLYINHLVNAKILYLWETKYNSFRLLDVPRIYSLMPLTVEDLLIEITRASTEAASYLNTEWITECTEIVRENKDNIEEAVENTNEETRMNGMDHFFGSLATLMSNLIRELVKKSIHDLVYLFELYRHGNKYEEVSYEQSGLQLPSRPHPLKFFMQPDVNEVCTTFEPRFDGIVEHLHNIIDVMVMSVQNLPKLEHLLFHAVENVDVTYLSAVKVEDEIVLVAKQRISAVIQSNSYGPIGYRSVYEPAFHHLLNAKTTDKVAHFIKREPPLRGYVKELEKLKSMARCIGSLPIHVPMHLFLLDCEHLNQWLLDRSKFLQKMMIDNVIEVSRKFNRSICTTYDEIVKRITSHVQRYQYFTLP